jgi:hypothetical protein
MNTLTDVSAPRVSPEELQAAVLVFARALREHLADGLAQGQLETVLSGTRCLEHLTALAGPAAAAQAFATACQESGRGT